MVVSDTEIKVSLGSGWRNGGQLVILLSNVTAGIPTRLTDTDDTDPMIWSDDEQYANFEFRASSKASGGVLINLRPILIDDDGDDTDDRWNN